MTRRFDAMGAAEFQDLIDAYPFSRKIIEVHLHHTWRPRQSDYRGLATIEGMWRYHTETMGWDDIAQHVSIAPDGAIWPGRNFNWAPASAKGFNGNEAAGPFMIELIGNFQAGAETPTDEQYAAALAVVKVVQAKFRLRPQDLRLHKEMSTKDCPGESLDKDDFIKRLRDCPLPNAAADGRARPREAPFPLRASRVFDVLQAMTPSAPQTDDMSNAEHAVGLDAVSERARGGRFGGGEVTGEMLEALADHVVNLERGQFSDDGRIETTAEDVDRLFTEVIPEAIAASSAERRTERRKFKLLFYAHGGLVSEDNALLGAFNQLKFWQDNGIFPIFFIWETGFAETIRQLVSSVFGGGRGARNWLTDATDALIEELVRAGQGDFIWGGMKSSAALASASTGGAHYVAVRTQALLRDHADDLEIHTVGHSAGSIFHAHFMHALAERDVPVTTAHFLAPAIRNDLFHDLVAPRLGDEIGPLTIFTMTKQREKDDTVAALYRKSLLYLIYEALEPKRKTDILGLELSLRRDDDTARIFGLNGHPRSVNEVVWSPSDRAASGSASDSRTHGGFDDDKATLESVLRRILDKRDGQPIVPFAPQLERSRGDFWTSQSEIPPHLEEFRQSLMAAPFGGGAGVTDGSSAPAPTAPVTAGGRRQALCIGIDQYPRSPLAGCVADARLWQRTLLDLGFDAALMVDHQATAAAIRERVEALVAGARPGDHIVLQYAGHGTQFTDRDGDEAGGDSPTRDECLCAIDCDSGEDGLVIDDQLRVIIDGLAEGAVLTVFFDCCHSGTATRAQLRAPGARGGDIRARYLAPSPQMQAAYRRARAGLQARGARPGTRQRDMLFSACTSNELAFESNGQGDFTLRATTVIRQGVAGLGNRDVHERILQAFGDDRRQNPELHGELALRAERFLGL